MIVIVAIVAIASSSAFGDPDDVSPVLPVCSHQGMADEDQELLRMKCEIKRVKKQCEESQNVLQTRIDNLQASLDTALSNSNTLVEEQNSQIDQIIFGCMVALSGTARARRRHANILQSFEAIFDDCIGSLKSMVKLIQTTSDTSSDTKRLINMFLQMLTPNEMALPYTAPGSNVTICTATEAGRLTDTLLSDYPFWHLSGFSGITKVFLRRGHLIDCFGLFYGDIRAHCHGGTGGESMEIIPLQPGEYITEIFGEYASFSNGTFISKIALVTNKRTLERAGVQNGRSSFQLNSNGKRLAFIGGGAGSFESADGTKDVVLSHLKAYFYC